jgi:hypothetical protein
MPQYQQILTSMGLGHVKPYLYKDGQMLKTDGGDYPLQQAEFAKSDLASWLGTPIFGEVTLQSQAKDLSITLDTVLIDLNQSKNIVRTEIAGRAGTVKEYISLGDYYIVLKGGFFNQDPEQYPTDDINTLIKILNLEEALYISSDFLQLFGIYNYAVATYNMGQSAGKMSSQLFEIRGYSDEPIELKLDEETNL